MLNCQRVSVVYELSDASFFCISWPDSSGQSIRGCRSLQFFSGASCKKSIAPGIWTTSVATCQHGSLAVKWSTPWRLGKQWSSTGPFKVFLFGRSKLVTWSIMGIYGGIGALGRCFWARCKWKALSTDSLTVSVEVWSCFFRLRRPDRPHHRTDGSWTW